MTSDREVLKEFIEVYRENPCLWDSSHEHHRNKQKKLLAWEWLTETLRKMDPDANLSTAKRKVDNFRSSFFRELRKVRASEKAGDGYVPNLWYYNLISFLEGKELSASRASASEPVECQVNWVQISDGESMESADPFGDEYEIPVKRKSSRLKGTPKRKISIELEQVPELKYEEPVKSNSFAVYVSEQLEQTTKFQRYVAEKLISDVLFLAKTGNLSYDSKLANPKVLCCCQNEKSEKTEAAEDDEPPKTLLRDLLNEKNK